ncbi:MAG TPA: OmpA family protein [Streptosporangiaceae bacterium]|nr:OmpA family protein [Streptosporangiaceae bacterium]
MNAARISLAASPGRAADPGWAASIGAAARMIVAVLVSALGVVGCRLSAIGQPGQAGRLGLPIGRPAALVLIVNPAAPGAAATVRNLLVRTTRPGEQLFLLDMITGTLLRSAIAPLARPVSAPVPPAPLPHGATAFQRARYHQVLGAYQASVKRAWADLYNEQARLLTAWAAAAASAVAGARNLPQLRRHAGLEIALRAGTADFASLQQAGVDLGIRKVVTILDFGGPWPMLLPSGGTSLRGTMIAIAGFTGTGDEEAALQAALLQAGAAKADILTPATSDRLAAVLRQGLDGAITVPLTDIRFAPASYKLLRSSIPALSSLLRLLNGRYADAAVTIDGYTDTLPVAGGNMRLSANRAIAVEQWLIDHGIAASRLQADGYGDTDPVAPNRPGGQPLNRRVLVVIDPVAPQLAPLTSLPAAFWPADGHVHPGGVVRQGLA